MRKPLLCAVLLFFSVMTAQAQQATKAQEVDIQDYIDCPATEMWPDRSLVSYSYKMEGGTCLLYLIADTRFGVEWHMTSSSISMTAGAGSLETVPENVIDFDKADIADGMKRCLRNGPRKKFLDEWLVPLGGSCENRGSLAGRHHRFENDRICLMGSFNCIPIALLRPEAQARVKKIFSARQKDKAKDVVSR